jgi:hypothetical protein
VRPSLFLGLAALLLIACGGNGAADGVAEAGAPPPTSDAGSAPREAGAAVDAALTDAAPTDASSPPAKDASPGGLPPGTPIDAGPTVAGTITVNPSTRVGTIPPAFVGLSYEKSELTTGLFRGDDAPLIALFKLLGPGLLRIGGNETDRDQWYTAPNGATHVITTDQVDALSAFAKAAGWAVLYGVNMKISSSAVAAQEAQYAASSLASSLYGFEIGNEPDLYGWSYADFTTKWVEFASAIRGAAGATTPLTGPASAANYNSWTIPFASDEGSHIRLLTQHYYRASGQDPSSTIAKLLVPDSNLDHELDALGSAASGASVAGGVRLSECNSYYGGGAPNVSNSYGSALWVIDFLFHNAEHGTSGVNLHGGSNGSGTTMSYSAIADDAKGTVVEVRPEFYGLFLFALAGPGPLYETTVSVDGGLNVSAYAVGAANGSTNIVVVSKDASSGVHATIDVGAAITAAGVTYLQGPSLDATSGLTVGGVGIDPSGSFSPPTGPIPVVVSGTKVTVDVPAASAALIHAK